jgi:flagellar protein FlaG
VDKVMVTIMLIIGGMVCCTVIINAIFPAITESAGAITSATAKIDDRIKSKVEIIEISDSGSDVYIWLKNVGATRIGGIDTSDVFFGLDGNFARIPYSDVVTAKPYWNYSIESGSAWGPTGTVKVTIYLDSAPSGNYYFKFVLPNGIADEEIYSTSLGEKWKISSSPLYASPC